MIELYRGDCLEIMPILPDGSIDAIIADLPYGTTACKWDIAIPLDRLWEQYKRLIKPNGAIVLFCSQPFTSILITSNLTWFKYCWVWDKKRGVGHLVAKYRPMQRTEDIAVFGKGRINYYPILVEAQKPRYSNEIARTSIMSGQTNPNYSGRWLTHKQPTTILEFPNAGHGNVLHPTQKPVGLLEYLIKTYTLPGNTILDNVMGSGSTGVACKNLGRKFIGIELDFGYFDVAKRRIEGIT